MLDLAVSDLLMSAIKTSISLRRFSWMAKMEKNANPSA